MALKTTKVRCTSCKTLNDANSARCSVCTKPITHNPMASQAVHDELMWAQPIATRRARKQSPTTKYVVAFVLLVALGAANYLYIGFGPDWAHDVPAHEKGFEWRTYNGDSYRADLPGVPFESTVTAGDTELSVASVWVNSRWNMTKDADTRTEAAIKSAAQSLFAIEVTAEGGKTSSLNSSAKVIVRNLLPGTEIEDAVTTPVDSPKYGKAVDFTAKFNGHPDVQSKGIVKARIWAVGNKTYVAATFFDDTVDEALHSKLVRSILPDTP